LLVHHPSLTLANGRSVSFGSASLAKDAVQRRSREGALTQLYAETASHADA